MYKLNFCEYNRSNQDYDTIFRPSGSGDFLFLMLKSPMKVYLEERLVITRENAYLPLRWPCPGVASEGGVCSRASSGRETRDRKVGESI